MIEVAEDVLALACWAVALTIFLYIMPKMREHNHWHVNGINVLGTFAGYLGFEAIADSHWLDLHYSVYLVGNALFPLGAALIIYGYWSQKKPSSAE